MRAPDRGPLRLASAVMFVTELERSVDFYARLLGWVLALREGTVALLVSSDGSQLYLRARGTGVEHPLGHVGIQYMIWTATDERDLDRCEQVLRTESSQVRRTTDDGITFLEGRGPDHVPVLITYPGPDRAPRRRILERIYAW